MSVKVKAGVVVVAAAVFASAGHAGHHHHRAAATADVYSAASYGSNVDLGRHMAAAYGWAGSQWTCLDELWTRESGWQDRIWNTRGSGAYGIPQALPGSKMASAGADWETDPRTQIRWGLRYIKGRYGTPCNAWAHEEANSWY